MFLDSKTLVLLVEEGFLLRKLHHNSLADLFLCDRHRLLGLDFELRRFVVECFADWRYHHLTIIHFLAELPRAWVFSGRASRALELSQLVHINQAVGRWLVCVETIILIAARVVEGSARARKQSILLVGGGRIIQLTRGLVGLELETLATQRHIHVGTTNQLL